MRFFHELILFCTRKKRIDFITEKIDLNVKCLIIFEDLIFN